tara:strand:+ start:138 stop:395 length:258 start_codon:yes stop_codon:yes gene_type:complete
MYIQIFGKESCTETESAVLLSKNLSESNQCLHNYVYKKLDKDFTEEELIEKFSDTKTPQIIVNGRSVGGYTQLKEYVENRVGKVQ